MLRFDFTGRHAVVTGGTRGIGAAVSRALLKAGATVAALFGGNAAAAAEFQESLPPEEKARFEAHCCDVADNAQVEAFFAEYDKAHPQLDFLVSGAGIRRDGVAAMLPEESWRAVLSVNLDGAFHAAKAAVLRMLRKRFGRIVMLTSPMGRLGWNGQANYAASKAGLCGLCRSLAKETARRGITVNCVSPGFIDTDFIGNLPEEQRKEYAGLVPLKRFGTAAEVASAILFLLSEEAAYITGSVLEIAGGL